MLKQLSGNEIITFKVDKDLKKLIQDVAQSEYRTVTGFIKNAIRYYIDNSTSVGTFQPTEEEKEMMRKSEENIKKGQVYKVDMNNLHSMFE